MTRTPAQETDSFCRLFGRTDLMTGPFHVRRIVWIVGGVVWFTAATAGLAWMANYANRPGAAADAPFDWPARSTLPRDASRPTLVMLAHPQCDCTRASLAELAELVARATRRPKTIVVFIRPPDVGAHWEQTALWRAAEQIPDTTVVRDDDGDEARRFRSETSGQTLLYGSNGHLLFSGGTTIARGHLGDNPGLAAILAILGGSDPGRTTTPVFGCSLFATAEAVRSQEASQR
jgi:hypothetical protein